MYNLLHLPVAEQWRLCQIFKVDSWYALTRGSTLEHRTSDRLRTLGTTLTVFRRGQQPRTAGGAWRLAKLKTVRTALGWTLQASRRAAGEADNQELKRLRLSRIRLTEDGVFPWTSRAH